MALSATANLSLDTSRESGSAITFSLKNFFPVSSLNLSWNSLGPCPLVPFYNQIFCLWVCSSQTTSYQQELFRFSLSCFSQTIWNRQEMSGFVFHLLQFHPLIDGADRLCNFSTRTQSPQTCALRELVQWSRAVVPTFRVHRETEGQVFKDVELPKLHWFPLSHRGCCC